MAEAGSPARTIVHVVESALAGVGRHVIDLSRGQAELGHDVHVIHSPIREDQRFRHARQAATSVSFHQLAMQRDPSLSDGASIRGLRRLLRDVPADVVHAHSSKAGLLVRSLPRIGASTVLYTPHAIVTLNPELSASQRRAAAVIERRLARRTAAVIAVAPYELEHLHSLGIDRSRTRLIPNGIDAYLPRPERDAVRKELGLPLDAVIVGFVGRLVAQKNPEAVLAALAHLDEDVHVAMVGDGPLAARVEQAGRAIGADRVHHLGDRDGHRAMFGFDCLALSSRYESAPYTALEAADAGIPLVTASGLPVWDEWTGMAAFPAASPAPLDFAAAIDRALIAGRSARRSVVRTVDQMVADVGSLFRYH